MANSSRRENQKRETRTLIKEAAYALFDRNGYEKTTMREVAREAGVAPGTIFVHFPDKASLLAAAFLDDLEEILRDSFRDLPQKGLLSELSHVVGRIYGFYARRPNFSRALLRELLFLEGPDGDNLEQQLAWFMKEVALLFRRAMERGELNPGTDLEEAMAAFGSFYFQGLFSGLREETFDVERQCHLFERFMKRFLNNDLEAGYETNH